MPVIRLKYSLSFILRKFKKNLESLIFLYNLEIMKITVKWGSCHLNIMSLLSVCIDY